MKFSNIAPIVRMYSPRTWMYVRFSLTSTSIHHDTGMKCMNFIMPRSMKFVSHCFLSFTDDATFMWCIDLATENARPPQFTTTTLT